MRQNRGWDLFSVTPKRLIRKVSAECFDQPLYERHGA